MAHPPATHELETQAKAIQPKHRRPTRAQLASVW